MNSEHSGFDPATFLAATTAEANTRRPPIPAGTVLRGTFGEPKIREVQGKKDTSKTYYFADIPVELDVTSNPQIHSLIGLDKVTLTHSFSVDIAPSGAGFDMSPGKNNGLRQLREALNMNVQGQPFNFLMVTGRPVLVTVKNEPYEGEVYDKVGSIAKIS